MTAANVASRLKQILEDLYGYSSGKIKLITNSDTTREGIVEAF